MLTDEQREFAISKYEGGSPPSRIAEILGVSIQCVVMAARRAGVPAQFPKMVIQGQKSADVRCRKKVQEQRNQLNREVSALKRAAGLSRMTSLGRAKKNSDVFWQDGTDTPIDTRCFTARFCGDPIFERSALYRKMKETICAQQHTLISPITSFVKMASLSE